jgi:hypothetical protein
MVLAAEVIPFGATRREKRETMLTELQPRYRESTSPASRKTAQSCTQRRNMRLTSGEHQCSPIFETS